MKFKFWKDNKIDQEYELTYEEVRQAYRKFCENKDTDWLVYYGNATVNFFIGDKEHGLNSVTESETYADLQEKLMDIRHEFYPKETV